jgi:hypothetical protein
MCYTSYISSTSCQWTVKQSGKVCAKHRIKLYKLRDTCDLYDNPEADANELQKGEQEEHDSSHEGEVSASNSATEILISGLQATGNHQLRSSCKKGNIQRKIFRKSPVEERKNVTRRQVKVKVHLLVPIQKS